MAALNWKHHTLIQSLMSRGPLKEDDSHKIFNAVTGKNPRTSERGWKEFLLKINKELSYVQMELRCCRNQNDGEVCYGIVNNVCDDQSKLGTKYSVPQITLFKAVIEAIVQDATAQGSISTIDALNIPLENQLYSATESESQPQGGSSQVPPALRNFSLSQKEKTLDELVHDKWLCRTPDGSIGLGVRSYLELRSWFHNSGTPSCAVCNEAAIKAKLCQNEGCTLRIHHYCLKQKFSRSKGKVVCPTCGIQWDFQVAKAEALEVEDEQNDPVESQPQQGPKPKRLKSRRNVDADAAGCSSSQASQSVSDTRRVTRASARSR